MPSPTTWGSWWPAEYTWAQTTLEGIAIEPKEGGRCHETGPHGFSCDWGRVVACAPPERLVFTWQISPDRTPQPDPERSSEVEVTFEAAENGTRVRGRAPGLRAPRRGGRGLPLRPGLRARLALHARLPEEVPGLARAWRARTAGAPGPAAAWPSPAGAAPSRRRRGAPRTARGPCPRPPAARCPARPRRPRGGSGWRPRVDSTRTAPGLAACTRAVKWVTSSSRARSTSRSSSPPPMPLPWQSSTTDTATSARDGFSTERT